MAAQLQLFNQKNHLDIAVAEQIHVERNLGPSGSGMACLMQVRMRRFRCTGSDAQVRGRAGTQGGDALADIIAAAHARAACAWGMIVSR
ncbi:MAG: hypothetical protein B7Z45_10130 [Azorhizobium sp. 12-66-6]|nr:MAG: hypothetical protein B7Z45_10130 [Azorhizobium sp. 12-66-6]